MKPGAAAAGSLLLVFLAWAGAPRAANLLPGNALTMGRPGSEVVLGSPVTLNADNLEYNEDTGVALAEGNVELGFGNRNIRADRIRYDSRSGEAEMLGRVHYKDEGDEFSFERIVLNLDTELGVLYKGTIRLSANNYQISSEKIEKTGPRTFMIQKGSLTTCPCDPEPDWKFDVRRSRVTIDGYATAKDATFRVRGVPVLWLPWAAFPVKLTRQSGFLLPNFSHSGTKGYTFQLPYYWAINRWSDATFTLEEMSRRGPRPEGEYRYVLNRDSEGEVHVSSYHDKETGGGRHRTYGMNRYRGGTGWTSNSRWDLASDGQYYLDLVEEDILRTGRNIPSRGFLSYGGDRSVAAMSAVFVKGTQGTFDDNAVQRLPEASITILPAGVGGSSIDASAEMSAAYFYRSLGERDLRGRGSAEVSRTFTLYPSVTATPFLFADFLGSYPVSEPGGAGNAGRILPGGGARIEADFGRTFRKRDGTSLLHVVQTSTSFRWIPSTNQEDIPVTDAWSRVGEQQQFTFSVTQRLLRVDRPTGPFELASLVVEWALDVGGRDPTGSPYIDPMAPFVRSLRDEIDLAAGRTTGRRDAASDVYTRFQVRPGSKWLLKGEMLFQADEGRFTTASVGGEWKESEESRALLEYRNSRGLNEDIHALFAFRLHRFLGIKTDLNYSLKNEQLVQGAATFTLHPKSECWSVGLETSRKTKPDETSYKLLFSLKGMGGTGK
ncbi:MAG: LPS-assembly protein LptD [Deltaproteobacteria bacterium]|nr:LPS-assembly protein LptD [Deltaproteobacteria bacterium]